MKALPARKLVRNTIQMLTIDSLGIELINCFGGFLTYDRMRDANLLEEWVFPYYNGRKSHKLT